MNTKCYYLLSLVLIFSACQKDIALEVPEEDPRIVLNGVVKADSVLRVFLSQSRFVLDVRSLTSIDNATLSLFEDGTPIGSWLFMGHGVYEAQGMKPVSGRRYQLKVKAPNMGEVSAEVVVPAPMTAVEIVSVDSTVNFSEKLVTVRMRLSDPAATNDFYLINRIEPVVYQDGSTIEDSYGYASIISESANVFNTCDEDWNTDISGCKVLFNDRTFNGKDREIVLSYRQYSWDEQQKPKSYLVVSSVTEDYYRYMISKYQNSTSEDNPFAEPVPIYMNVSGGYGILGGSASASWFYIP